MTEQRRVLFVWNMWELPEGNGVGMDQVWNPYSPIKEIDTPEELETRDMTTEATESSNPSRTSLRRCWANYITAHRKSPQLGVFRML